MREVAGADVEEGAPHRLLLRPIPSTPDAVKVLIFLGFDRSSKAHKRALSISLSPDLSLFSVPVRLRYRAADYVDSSACTAPRKAREVP
jgi:hypothetical protein